MIWLWRLIIGGLWKPILAVLTALGLYAKIRSGDKAKAKNAALKADAQATERMNDAPTLRNASDTERTEWLRKFADRNRRD